MLQLSCLSGLGILDVGIADCDADGSSCGGGGGGGPCLLHSALCCPTDSLDDDDAVVIETIEDEQLLLDLAIAASLPPGQELLSPTTGHRSETTKSTPVHDAAALLHNSNRNSLWRTAWTTTTSSSSSLASAGSSTSSPAGVWPLVVPSRKRDRSSSASAMRGTYTRRSWLSSLDMTSIPTRRRSPDSSRRGNGHGVRQPQGLVAVSRSRRGAPTRSRRSSSTRRVQQRACKHCGGTETPHWRAGPDGPATLCNACGIRYTREQCKQLPEHHRRASSTATAASGSTQEGVWSS